MSKKILLIEDDEFLHELYSDLLEAEGYVVTGIKDGSKACEKMKENTWDLILLDVMLPGLSGFEIMDQITKDNVRLSCPIVYLTNLDSTATDLINLSKATDHWTKSDMSPPEFIAKVKSML